MKQTNKFILFLFLLIVIIGILGTTVSAGLLPLILYGEASYNGAVYSNVQISISDDRGNSWGAYTTGSGVFTFDVGNFQRSDKSFVEAGDKLILSICPEVGCKKEVIVSSEPLKVDFGVSTVNCPVIRCPECRVCEVCKEIEPCSECDEDKLLVGFLASLIGFLAGGVGIYFFKRKDAVLPNGTFIKFGGVGPKHLHRGIKGYHDPKVSHRLLKEKHPKGMLDPKYVKGSDGEWFYQE